VLVALEEWLRKKALNTPSAKSIKAAALACWCDSSSLSSKFSLMRSMIKSAQRKKCRPSCHRSTFFVLATLMDGCGGGGGGSSSSNEQVWLPRADTQNFTAHFLFEIYFVAEP
jgi:hypothetical protein